MADIDTLRAENERLRAENERLRAALYLANNERDNLRDNIDRLESEPGTAYEAASQLRLERLTAALDENERLRAALAKIDDGYGPDHLSMYCRDIARAFRAHP